MTKTRPDKQVGWLKFNSALNADYFILHFLTFIIMIHHTKKLILLIKIEHFCTVILKNDRTDDGTA